MIHDPVETNENATLIEEFLQLSAEVGVSGTVVFGELLLLYVLVGAVVTMLLSVHTPYPFFSLEADPVLLIDGMIIGICTVQSAGSLILYNFFSGIDDEALASVTLSFVALGVGGALLQLTVPEVWELLVGYI